MPGASPRTLATAGRFCVTDIGSTTTKAILFEKHADRWRFFRQEAPTTVEKPCEDVSVGVLRAFRALERETGRKLLERDIPCVPYLSTSSAGGGLAMVVTGLIRDLTAESADRVALGAGAIVLDVIAMNDGRTPYRKIEDLKTMRPDMVLLAGGFDGDNTSGPVYLAELIAESGLHPKLNPSARLDVVYGGNINARKYVAQVLKKDYQYHEVPNVRPEGARENPAPARRRIHELFMEHVMSQAPGYESIKPLVAAPIRPTPAAFGNLLALLSRDLGKTIMAIDIGGATTDVFSAVKGRVFRTVSANLGMSYSIRNVAENGGMTDILRLIRAESDVSDAPPTERELWDRVGNKHIHPTALPATAAHARTEWAVATVAIRRAVIQHLRVMHSTIEEHQTERPELDVLLRGSKPNWMKEIEIADRIDLALEDYDLIIGSGGILSHSPRGAAAMILLDALQPDGAVELAVDSAFMFPHLGILAELDEELALELCSELGIVRLGTVCAPAGHGPAAEVRVLGSTTTGRGIDIRAEPGTVEPVPLGEDETAKLTWTVHGVSNQLTAQGGVVGLVVDNRARPVELSARRLALGDHVPASRDAEPEIEKRLVSGDIRMRRELATPGKVLVSPGDRVGPDTIVARSVRQFLRPFFLDIASALEVAPDQAAQYLVKKVGDELGLGDIIASRPRRFLPPKVVRSNVRARIEKVLPNGAVVARELPELAKEYTTVPVAKELGKAARKIKPYLKVEPGQAVDRGQWLAVDPARGFRFSASPVRGKVNRIDLHFGVVIIEPLLEKEEVRAWFPGVVEETSDRGCLVVGRGVTVNGIWGMGGERHGRLTLGEPTEDSIVVRQFADADVLGRLEQRNAAGLVTGGVHLQDVLGGDLGFTIVVLGGFGRRQIPSELQSALEAHEGRLALADGTTQLRVGVRRPRVVLPEIP
ncbi:MAG: glutamate mutase L [candidate division WOR-3 bacterium]|nr:MAG: glutamate mutase L [candidate division WOR-3 bacterium]